MGNIPSFFQDLSDKIINDQIITPLKNQMKIMSSSFASFGNMFNNYVVNDSGKFFRNILTNFENKGYELVNDGIEYAKQTDVEGFIDELWEKDKMQVILLFCIINPFLPLSIFLFLLFIIVIIIVLVINPMMQDVFTDFLENHFPNVPTPKTTPLNTPDISIKSKF